MDRLTREQQRIFDLLVEKAKDRGYTKLAYATIAQYTRMSVATVRAYIWELEKMGLIRKELVPNSSNRYWINEVKPEPNPAIPSIWMPEPKYYVFA